MYIYKEELGCFLAIRVATVLKIPHQSTEKMHQRKSRISKKKYFERQEKK